METSGPAPGRTRRDLIALLAWTFAVAWMFRKAILLQGALFYFDITEINYPYRHFFAEELKAGRFSRWCPWLYCGLPLFSESQAGYLHPLKYLLYPWMETWKAFNLDVVLSIWLTGLGTFGWLRRHVGPAGALTGAAIFGFGGFTWAHLVHTSMINALASVPFCLWALEWAWAGGAGKAVALGAYALACQVFAGHLQDVLLTSGILGFYGLYRALTERDWASSRRALGLAVLLIGLGVLFAGVQWVPSKELLDRSPRAGGLSYEELTYGSWHPELIPTVVIREAYGTRARDTDWPDGFYPYHEMDTYLGLVALSLAIVGAGGIYARDRWATFWVLVAVSAGVLMLGRYTFLFDYAPKIPVLGSSREPVRFHLWLTAAIAALAALGVERLKSVGNVRLRGAVGFGLFLVIVSIPILAYIYEPFWTERARWTRPYHLDRYRWLGQELAAATARTAVIAMIGLGIARWATRVRNPLVRARLAALLPFLVLADLMLAHRADIATVAPEYWTSPPSTVEKLRTDSTVIRVFGKGDKSAGEPGYASESVDFLATRDPLDWSLPAAWGLSASKGETPMIPRRLLDYFDHASLGAGRFDIEGVSHILTGKTLTSRFRTMPSTPVGTAFLHRNASVLPRARLVGQPIYVDDQAQAVSTVSKLGPDYRSHVVVEDPDRPLPPDSQVSGSAEITIDLPEHVEVQTEAQVASYLVLADTFDPGWSATIDNKPTPIRPAFVAFRAVYLGPGSHKVVFTYRPAGFAAGLSLSISGLALAIWLLMRRGTRSPLTAEHASLHAAGRWRACWLIAATAIIIISALPIPGGRSPFFSRRWDESFHRFTWGAGIQAMKENRH